MAGGYDLVGDAFNANDANPVITPDPDPDDCAGHGTHVSGIAAAKAAAPGGVTGVAPDAKIYAYRVFGCVGTTLSSVMLEAMERALRDKVDVLNMSIGAAFQNWPQYPTAAGASRLARKGVVVVASIGNSGTSGMYAAGAPGVGKDVIGVASFNNTHLKLAAFSITPDSRLNGYNPAAAAPPAPLSGTSPLARTGTQARANDGCNAVAPAPGSLTGKVALIRRGTCGFFEKALNAQNAGAAGVVLYNNQGGTALINPTVAGATPITIPVVFISQNDGNAIDTRLAGGAVSMTWTDMVITLANPGAGLISTFSSFGLAADLSLKPDIGAPGGAIRSTIPIEQGSYGNNDGTSMASPHTAGGAALLLQAVGRRDGDDDERRGLKAIEVRDILQNSARPALWTGNPGLGFLDNVQRQGAGMLDINGAIHARAAISPGKLSLGEGSGLSGTGPRTATLRVKRVRVGNNDDGASVTYDITHVPALATGGLTNSPSFFNAPAMVAISPATVTLGGDEDDDSSATKVQVTVTPNAALPDRSVYGGYIVFTPQDGGQVLRVPFAGFKGDYQSIVVLTPFLAPPNSLPWLIRGSSLAGPLSGGTFTLQGTDTPTIAAHFEHQAQRVRIEVFQVNGTTETPFHRLPDETLIPRNASAGSVFLFPWNGNVVRVKKNGKETEEVITAPDGQYKLKMTALKALGDETNPAHSEIFTTPVFTIDRP